MNRRSLLSCALLLLVGSGAVYGSVMDELKARMEKRLPAIAKMKRLRAVGENNQGYLEILEEGKADRDLVQAENKDRRRVYEAIAQETGVDVDTVGRRRAKQIAERSAPGMMVQDAKGAWAAKPASASK